MSYSNIPVEITERGMSGVASFTQDQTTTPLTFNMLRTLNTTALAVDAVVGSYSVTLATGHAAVIGDVLDITDNLSPDFIQADILNVVGDVVTIDEPVSGLFTVSNSIVRIRSRKMQVNGSVTPVMFTIKPVGVQAGDMVSVQLSITGSTEMDFSSFGSNAALTRGILLRVKRSDGSFRNLVNIKSNGDFIKYSRTHSFLLPKTGNTLHGFFGKLTYGGQDNAGVVIRLDAARGEELQALVQDDLTGGDNTDVQITVQGSELQHA